MQTDPQLNFLYSLLPFALIVFVIALGVVLLTHQFRKRLLEQQRQEEELKYQHQQELLVSSIAVQEEERKRIAQDMHDELGAALSIARMNLLQLERQGGADAASLLASLQNIRSLTENSLAAMRRISHALLPLQLERYGLVPTLTAMANQLGEGMEIKLHVADTLPDMPWPVTLGLYRILMELINNTIKHAGATVIDIGLSATEKGYFSCTYTDNGHGFAIDANNSGLGLKNIQGRVNALKGSIQMGTAPAGGFIAAVQIPA